MKILLKIFRFLKALPTRIANNKLVLLFLFYLTCMLYLKEDNKHLHNKTLANEKQFVALQANSREKAYRLIGDSRHSENQSKTALSKQTLKGMFHNLAPLYSMCPNEMSDNAFARTRPLS